MKILLLLTSLFLSGCYSNFSEAPNSEPPQSQWTNLQPPCATAFVMSPKNGNHLGLIFVCKNGDVYQYNGKL